MTLLASQSFAADVADLYQAQLPVSSQSEGERQQIAPKILSQVILKVVGDRAAISQKSLEPVLTKTDEFIQQYQYDVITSPNDDMTTPERLEVELLFNQEKLDSALAELGLPIWGKTRPEVLIWSAVEEGEQRTILSMDKVGMEIVDSLNQCAIGRGLPILFPVMDLDDQRQVKFTDVWAGFSDTVEAASQRYGTTTLLMIKTVVLDDGLVQVDWHARINGQSEQWQSRGEIKTVMSSGVDELTDRLARQFSHVQVAQQSNHLITLEINDVNNYSDYEQLVNYVTNLQYISDVKVFNLVEDKLIINVSFKGNIAILDRTLAIDRFLIIDSDFSTENFKKYRLAP